MYDCVGIPLVFYNLEVSLRHPHHRHTRDDRWSCLTRTPVLTF